MFFQTQIFYAFLRAALVAASATFTDIGDKRKSEYLEKIIGDALS